MSDESRQMEIRNWLDAEVGEIDGRAVKVIERISYLVVCNGGYADPDNRIGDYIGVKVGPFTMGLSLKETLELAFYVGMLSGIDLIGFSAFELVDEYIHDYLKKSIEEYGIDVEKDAKELFKDGMLSLEEFTSISEYVNTDSSKVMN